MQTNLAQNELCFPIDRRLRLDGPNLTPIDGRCNMIQISLMRLRAEITVEQFHS